MTSPQTRVVAPVAYYTYEEYNAAEQANTAAMIALLILYLRPYVGVPLSDVQWVEILKFIYPSVEYYREQSARLARRFYDSERRRYLNDAGVVDLDSFRPDSPTSRHDVYLANYSLSFFIEDMGGVRKQFVPATATNKDLTQVIGTAVKQVQNGGRRTNLEAVRTDPLGVKFARVEGGGSSCAFCLMLISRGPVYHSALSAGTSVEAAALFDQIGGTDGEGAIEGLMNRWHENCDCRVVPVFDEASWPGREKYLEALEIWKAATTGETAHTRNYAGNNPLIALRRYIGDGYSLGQTRLAA